MYRGNNQQSQSRSFPFAWSYKRSFCSPSSRARNNGRYKTPILPKQHKDLKQFVSFYLKDCVKVWNPTHFYSSNSKRLLFNSKTSLNSLLVHKCINAGGFLLCLRDWTQHLVSRLLVKCLLPHCHSNTTLFFQHSDMSDTKFSYALCPHWRCDKEVVLNLGDTQASVRTLSKG